MAAALTERPTGTGQPSRSPDRSPIRPAVVGIAVGPDLDAVLRAALAGCAGLCAAGDPDGLVVAVRVEEVAAAAGKLVGLEGLPVAAVVVGACPEASAEALASLRQAVLDGGGFPVGAGVWLDPVDAQCGPDGLLVDLTVHATLAQLGNRVQHLAWSRRVLRRS